MNQKNKINLFISIVYVTIASFQSTSLAETRWLDNSRYVVSFEFEEKIAGKASNLIRALCEPGDKIISGSCDHYANTIPHDPLKLDRIDLHTKFRGQGAYFGVVDHEGWICKFGYVGSESFTAKYIGTALCSTK